MTTFEFLLQGLLSAMEPINLVYALIGVTLGTAVGVLPGIGPALTTVALLLPVTYRLDPAGSLIMFAGIYYGGMYGGSTTSILLNTPGESASIVTALEGNKMAKAGRGGPALATSAIGSFVAGLIATIAAGLPRALGGEVRHSFGPREYFALMVLAFVTVSAAFGDSALRGLTCAVHRTGLFDRRHRPADRPGAPLLRHSRPARWHRGDDDGSRHVRHRRNAVRGGAGHAGARDGRAGAWLACG
jgi:putative tricarboxylic transport membrane protein